LMSAFGLSTSISIGYWKLTVGTDIALMPSERKKRAETMARAQERPDEFKKAPTI